MDKPGPELKKCGCGKVRTLDDGAIISDPAYGFWANLTLLWGVTAAPRRIDYRCVQCGQVVGSTNDPQALRSFTH